MQSQNAVANQLVDKSLLRPLQYPGLIRMGPAYDGGYIVPKDQIGKCDFLISLGLSDNWQFDKEFLAKNPKTRIVGVDHTVGSWTFALGIIRCLWKIPGYALIFDRKKLAKYIFRLRNYFEYFSFFKEPHLHIKKRVSTDRGPIDISLGEIFSLVPPTAQAEDDTFFKMDIEGGEYALIDEIVRNQSRIRCLVAEFHDLHSRAEQFNKAILGLSENFHIIHIHGNNCGEYDRVNDFPTVVEITFINKSATSLVLSPSTCQYPIEGLDFPDHPGRPEFELHL